MSTSNKPSRRWIAVVYLVLVALAIPWYWPSDDVRQFLGLPLWTISVLGVLLATACFTAWVYMTSPDED